MEPTYKKVALVLGALGCFACADEDTIVALNINSTDAVGAVDSLRVTFRQEGQSAFRADIDPPLESHPDAGMSIVNTFFRRIALPESWRSGDATVEVDALDAAAQVLVSGMEEFRVRKDGAVAVFVALDPMAPPDGMGGSGGMDAGVDDAGMGGAGMGGAGGSSGGGMGGGGAANEDAGMDAGPGMDGG